MFSLSSCQIKNKNFQHILIIWNGSNTFPPTAIQNSIAMGQEFYPEYEEMNIMIKSINTKLLIKMLA